MDSLEVQNWNACRNYGNKTGFINVQSLTDYIINAFGFDVNELQKDDFMLSVDYYYKKFDCGKEKSRHLNVAEFSTFWRKFTKIYTTIDGDGSGEIEFCELMRYLKICAHKMRVSKVWWLGRFL